MVMFPVDRSPEPLLVQLACVFCGKRSLARRGELPEGWSMLGTNVACSQCQKLARLLTVPR